MVNLQKQFLLLLLGITVVPREIQENALFFREAGVGGGGGKQGVLWELCKYMVNYSAVTTLTSGDKFQYILFYNFTVICFVAIFYCMTMSLDND